MSRVILSSQGRANYINTVKKYFNEVHATLGGTKVSNIWVKNFVSSGPSQSGSQALWNILIGGPPRKTLVAKLWLVLTG